MYKKIILLITIVIIIGIYYKNSYILLIQAPLIKGEKNIITNLEGFSIEKIKNSIVIIIPETELISYKNNPVGIFEEYKESGIGAGFFIDDTGIIQTVNHLVEDDKKNYKILYKNKEYNSIVISRNKEKDLANLKIISKEKITFPLLNSEVARGLGENNDIYSFGVDVQKMEIIYNTGIILKQKIKLNNMSNLIEVSNTLKPGFSGGPIINSKGNIIGINYAISQGKNYAISLY